MEQDKREKIIDGLKEILIYVIIISLVLLFKTFIATPVRVNGSSMLDTLKNGDIMILNKIKYKYSDIKRFDIVVVNKGDEKLIKRVIGLPGEEIEYKDNSLYVNGKRVVENFKHKKTEDFNSEGIGHKVIPEDFYLVLGDNRPNSTDSRIIGLIYKSRIAGKTSFILFPLNRIGIVK